MSGDYQRPIRARYLDPVEVVWLATARRLGLTIRRDPSIFSMTDGSGMLWLGPRADLDPDDSLAQMLLHEVCHWITNGHAAYRERDWGFALEPGYDAREYACLRLQAWLAQRHGLRDVLGPTSFFRQYWDRLPADPLEPLDDSAEEAEIVRLAREAVARAVGDPWGAPLDAAFAATSRIRGVVGEFLDDYATEIDGDDLPSLWA